MTNKFIMKRLGALILSGVMCVTSSMIVVAEQSNTFEISIMQQRKNEENNLTLTEKQTSAISMLNYITVLSQEINSSSNSKLYLDNAYSAIVNNINPNAVDNDSMSEIRTLLNTINAYQSIATKRERLRYIYQQNQAKAIQKALPNPMSILNIVQADNPAKALISSIYMAVDSKSSYESYVSESSDKYMQDGWALDDEASENLYESRTDAFAYMVEMCNENDLDGKLALNENAVAEFVKWENNTNVTRRIEFLEKNQSTYCAYGKYWLVLAESYYDAGEYQKCLNAINKYEAMDIIIFRKDHDFAKTLTIGLAAAGEIKEDIFYVNIADHYLDLLLDNMETNDWTLRYVAATSYMDLFKKTDDKAYLVKAYDLIKENVNYLIDEQYTQNDIYMAEILKQTAKKTDSKETKKEIDNYNKWIKEERKRELPPVYEPLVMNCELLFGLADELGISRSEQKTVNNMLHSGDKPLFLVAQLENKYTFDSSNKVSIPDIEFDGKKLYIPANLLSQGTQIRAYIIDESETNSVEDWNLIEVDRGKETTVDKFIVTYESKIVKKYDFKDGDRVRIDIIPPDNSVYDTISFTFSVSVTKKLKILSDTKFILETSSR